MVHVLSNYDIILPTPSERSESMTNKPPKKSAPTPEECAWFESHLTHEVWRRLYHEAYRVLQNKSDAEDATEEAIHIGIANISHLRQEEKFFSWMFKIVRREAYRHYAREHKVQTLRYRLTLMRDLYEANTTPDNLIITKEEHDQLRQEIERLKSPDREIMLLKLTTRKTLKEIAADLDLNYHTTRSKFTRSCHLIKQRLKAEGVDDSHEEE